MDQTRREVVQAILETIIFRKIIILKDGEDFGRLYDRKSCLFFQKVRWSVEIDHFDEF